jgi:chemotaxis protein MotA
MNLIAGIVLVLGCVAGGFVLSHGQLGALWQPYEVLIIMGAAIGAMVMGNPGKILKKVGGNFSKLVKGSPYDKTMYLDLLSMISEILNKARKEGMIKLEEDVGKPDASPIFTKYPKILADHHVIEFITDYLRLMVDGITEPLALESLMDVELETHHEEGALPAAVLTRMADGLPGFGIVAAVLGIVITMASLGGPPEVLGHHVAAALVGTFLGILLAYGFVAPMSTFLEHVARDEAQFYKCIKTCMVSSLQGFSPTIAVEFGRKAIFHTERPTYAELEEHMKKG